jgi:hypothetical protein
VTNPEILEQELCRAEDLYLSQLDTELLRAESAELVNIPAVFVSYS